MHFRQGSLYVSLVWVVLIDFKLYCMARDILGAPLLEGKRGWYSSSARCHLTCDQSHHYHYHHRHHFFSTVLTFRVCEQFRPIGEMLKISLKVSHCNM